MCGDLMKKSFKILSVLVSFVLLFTSCGKATPQKTVEKIKSYFESNNYSECKSYLSSIDSGVKVQISDSALDAVKNEFSEIYKKYENYDIFDITLFDTAFVEKCVKLWGIASEFTPSEDKKFDEQLQYLRYFSEISDSMRYKEMFRMLKDMSSAGYFYTIQKSLNDYEVLGDYKLFEDTQKICSEFDVSEYNPQEYYITELRSACEQLNKHLISVNNGFVTGDTAVIADAIGGIYDKADTFLFACDSAETVYSSLNEAMNTFRINGAFADFKNEISFGEGRKYTTGTEFPLSFISGSAYVPNDDNNDKNGNETDTPTGISKKEAIRIAVNAINKTKAYKSDITLNRTQTVNVQMTSFETESEITSAVTLVKVKINDALKASNGTSKGTMNFSNGVSENLTLDGSIPPSDRKASLDSSFVESYTAVKGTGGYVITFNLYSCTSTDDNLSKNLLSIVDGFYFDKEAPNIEHETFYGPTAISLVVNNYGYLSKYDYSISGVADCKFIENGEKVGSGKFDFQQKYSYNFVY